MFKKVIYLLGIICVVSLVMIGQISIADIEDTFVSDNLVHPLRWADGTEADYSKVKYRIYEGNKDDYYDWFKGRTSIREYDENGTENVLSDPSELIYEDDGYRLVVIFPLVDEIHTEQAIHNYDWFELRFLYYNF